MKKIVSLLTLATILMSFISVSADSYKNNIYTFNNVNSTASFDKDGEALSIDTEAVLRFKADKVNMTLEGDADNAMLQQIILTKYDTSEITYTLQGQTNLKSVVFRNGEFEPVEIEQGAYLLVLSTNDEKGSAVLLLVGEQTVMPEEEIASKPEPIFGDNINISDWAITEVSEAYNNSLITIELYNNGNFKRNITRGEFAHVMAQLLIQCGADYNAFAKKLGNNPDFKFTDTNGDLEIEFVSDCGVINGMTETEFWPYGELTREQAAAMLSRTADYVGLKTNISSVTPFADEAEFSSWAKDSIYTVASLRDKANNYSVMGGMGDGIFSAKTGYTVEQALIAVKRLLRAVK